MDDAWWRVHIDEVRGVFSGDLVSSSQTIRKYGVESLGTSGVGWNPYGNSGAAALSLACLASTGPKYLIGYDCKKSDGQAHWHADHPKGLGNAGSIAKWPAQFTKLRAANAAHRIFNCSRDTALFVFPRMTLEDALT